MENITGGDRYSCANQAMGESMGVALVTAIGSSFFGPFSFGAATVGFVISLAVSMYKCHKQFLVY